MRWIDLQDRQAKLGEIASERLLNPGVVLVVTLRKDGTPRLSPVEPFVLDGDLWLSMMPGSRKAADLLRDPRILVHSVITRPDGEEGELKLRGSVRVADDTASHERYAAAVSATLPWSPVVGRFHLFAVDIDEVTFVRYDNATGDQHLVLWPPGRETVRRGTSATTVGPPIEVRQILVE